MESKSPLQNPSSPSPADEESVHWGVYLLIALFFGGLGGWGLFLFTGPPEPKTNWEKWMKEVREKTKKPSPSEKSTRDQEEKGEKPTDNDKGEKFSIVPERKSSPQLSREEQIKMAKKLQKAYQKAVKEREVTHFTEPAREMLKVSGTSSAFKREIIRAFQHLSQVSKTWSQNR